MVNKNTCFWLIVFLIESNNAICSVADIAKECDSLIDIGHSLSYQNWTNNTNWMSKETICNWYGIECTFNETINKYQTTAINLSHNNIFGSLPESISALTMLSTLDLTGHRPSNYYGCLDSNLNKTALPESIYNLHSLTTLNLEYTCLGGTVSDKIGSVLQLEYLRLHGNFVEGTIPKTLDNLINLIEIKFGRNPMNGTIPMFNNVHPNVTIYCGNFCAFTGEFPDIFPFIPNINLLYWDGNNLFGSLPESIDQLKYLTGLAFNINNFNGTIPASYCDLDPNENDCRIGHDTNYTAYQANMYQWIVPANGNLYHCNAIPLCIKEGVCNSTDSPVLCN